MRTLKVSTRGLGETIEVRVRGNGIGILRELRDKLCQPFFTTKPTGEETGLGLSFCYDVNMPGWTGCNCSLRSSSVAPDDE